ALITATIANQGPGPAAATTTVFTLDGKTLLGTIATAQLPRGGSVKVSIPWDTSKVKGQHTLAAAADAGHVLDETNATNDSGVLAVTVKSNKITNGTFQRPG